MIIECTSRYRDFECGFRVESGKLDQVNDKQDTVTGPGLAGIVLAAGASRRLGRPKQLVEWNGTTLLERTVHAIFEYCDCGVICVLGAYDADVRTALEGCDVRIVVNTEWREGIGASIRSGVEQVPANARAILLTVCDQPRVQSSDFARLIADWCAEPQAVVAAGYGDGYGVPAIFPVAYRDDLTALHGDRGAKAVIGAAPRKRIVEMPTAAFDIDHRDDLARLQENTGR